MTCTHRQTPQIERLLDQLWFDYTENRLMMGVVWAKIGLFKMTMRSLVCIYRQPI